MSLLDSVINPAVLNALDPATRKRIEAGVKAGALTAAAIEAKQRFAPTAARPIAADAKIAVKNFNKNLREN